jgi:hypothetical protein
VDYSAADGKKDTERCKAYRDLYRRPVNKPNSYAVPVIADINESFARRT